MAFSRALRVLVDKRPARFANSAAADAITLADVGADCYMVDDQTVAKTHGGNTRSVLEYDWPGQRIWGATAAKLANLHQRLQQA